MAEKTTEGEVLDPERVMFLNAKQSGYNYRERRHIDWTDNYDLYRGKVQTNRLTQRQTVHIPLMKMAIRSLLKDVDDMPVLYYENLDNDKDAEVFKNEYWKYTVEENRMELQDIVDKKQVMIYGRSYDQWQIVDGKVKMTIQDPMDILIDRYADPFNIHSSRFLIHTHIFTPLSALKNNPEYDQAVVAMLEQYYNSEAGVQKSAENEQMYVEKMEKMADMGVLDVYDPVVSETIVELTLFFHYAQYDTKSPEQTYLTVYAEDLYKLQRAKLEEVIGQTQDHFWRTHYPYNSWADDLERQDWFSDSTADIIRTANVILDVFYSQLVENRTLRSFDMWFYDQSSSEAFVPQVWEPIPFGMYGVPGKPTDIMMKMDIPDLSESLNEMQYIQEITEKATGATATQQGAQTQRNVTLGEVQLALGEAKERIKGMSKFYTPAWKERGLLFVKLVEAGADKLDAVTIYKKGKNTDSIYSRVIEPDDWKSKAGYRCKVWSQDERNEENTQQLEKLTAIATMFPGNPKMDEIKKRRGLEFAGLNPDEINEVMQFEQQRQQMLMSMQGQGMEAPGVPAVPGGQAVPTPQANPQAAPPQLALPQGGMNGQ